MPRFKPVHKGLKLLPVDYDKQIQSGSFEFALETIRIRPLLFQGQDQL
jgi:hypothetical protein